MRRPSAWIFKPLVKCFWKIELRKVIKTEGHIYGNSKVGESCRSYQQEAQVLKYMKIELDTNLLFCTFRQPGNNQVYPETLHFFDNNITVV